MSEQILNTDDKAAKQVSGISGWVDRHGRFWGDDERMARWSGSTHKACDTCGEIHERNSYCRPCHERGRDEKYHALEKREWDGECALYSDSHDQYFFDEDGLRDYLIDHECTVGDLQLCLCRPVKLRELDSDYFCDDLPEDVDVPDGIMEALEVFNEAISKISTLAVEPDKYAAIVNIDLD